MDVRLAHQYFVSDFRMSINLIRKMYGYEARQKTPYVICKFLEHARMMHIPFHELEGFIAKLLIGCGNMADCLENHPLLMYNNDYADKSELDRSDNRGSFIR